MSKENYENQNETNEIKYIKELADDFCSSEKDFCLTDSDFYPPADDRYLESFIEDINDEDNFVEYSKYIFDLYEEENFYEN